MYQSNRDSSITMNPRKTNGKNVEVFIKEKCMFSYGANSITEDIFDKYVRYCNDNNLEHSNFNVFARAFRYFVIHQRLIPGVGVFPVNYQAYKQGFGYITKQGWSYSNLVVNY